MQVFLITANRTKDGRTVYLRRDFTWDFDLREAVWTLDTDERDDLLVWARTQELDVCDPSALKVELDPAGGLKPIGMREQIRAAGPDATLASLGLG
jgi:hypothetical protein